MYNVSLNYQENRLMMNALKAENIDSSLLTKTGESLISFTYMFSIFALKTMQRVISQYPVALRVNEHRGLGYHDMQIANQLCKKLDLTNNVLTA